MGQRHHHPDSCPTCGGPAECTPAGWRVIPPPALGDETRPFPPIRTTIRRRPPAPDVRELRGAELLRALADELDREDLAGEDL